MVEMEGESRRGGEETRDAKSSNRCTIITNPSSLPHRSASLAVVLTGREVGVDNDTRSCFGILISTAVLQQFYLFVAILLICRGVPYLLMIF